MDPQRAIAFLIDRFPVLEHRVDEPSDLLTGPHFVYSLLATEALEKQTDEAFLQTVGQFINDLANSGDCLLEELLVIDVLEGIAQSPDLSNKIRLMINHKAQYWLNKVETEVFGRKSQAF